MEFPGHFQHIFQQLNEQRLHAQMCDCVVVVGGQRFQAHRSILAACSSHFKALLGSSDDAEGDEKGGIVTALDPGVVTPEAFSTLLDMIYTSTLSLGSSNVMDVLLAASHLHLNAVVKACKLHLSRKNFPSSPPKGWRSVQQQSPSSGEVVDNEGGVEMEVSQSGGAEDEEVRWIGDVGEIGQKRKHQERAGNRKRSCRSPGGWGCSRTVTRSTICIEEEEEEESCLKTTIHISEVEGKYEVTKGESDEIQLPSSSSSGGVWESSGDTKVKVKEAEEEEAVETNMLTVEVKKESPDPTNNISPSSPLQDSTQLLAAHLNAETLTSVDSLQLGSELPEGDAEDGDGLDSLSELAFSSFLNPSNDCVMGGLGEEESLASLTAAATAAAAAASEAPGEAQSDSSSLVLTPVPLQQLLPGQSSGFRGTLILQPAQNSLGFISNLGVQVARGQQGNTRGASGGGSGTLFRRIAPKAQPESESDPMSEPGSAAEPDPPFIRASEETVAKCKKAAAEDNVLLVEGEKKYACKICSKTFMNLTDCKKHIRVHTGEKPYPCPKCGKRFSQSSHLYKHSKNSTCLSWRFDQTFQDPSLT